jgi:hypothetical protein
MAIESVGEAVVLDDWIIFTRNRTAEMVTDDRRP